MPMLARDNVCLQSSTQDRQLTFHRPPIHKLKQTQTFIVRDCEHRSERRLDSFGKQATLLLRHRRWFTENPRKSVSKTTGRIEAAAVLRFIHRTTKPDLAKRKSHPPRAVISLKCHPVVPFKLPTRRRRIDRQSGQFLVRESSAGRAFDFGAQPLDQLWRPLVRV